MGDSAMPILTLCFPTFNRCRKLDRALAAALPQAERSGGRALVYVSDNCSTDDTESVVRSWQERYPGMLHYRRLERNLGADGNFVDCMEKATSRYVALLGDDDFVLPYYVDAVLTALENHPDVSWLHYNELAASADLSKCVGLMSPMFNGGRPRCYARGCEFIRDFTVWPSHITSNVFDREAFLSELEEVAFEEYPGFGWFMLACWSMRDRPCVYLDYPLTMYRMVAVKEWSAEAPWYFQVGFGRVFERMESVSPGISEKWRLQYCREISRQRDNLTDAARARSLYRGRFATMCRYSPSAFFTFMLFLVVYANCPTVVIALVYKFLRVWQRLTGGAGC